MENSTDHTEKESTPETTPDQPAAVPAGAEVTEPVVEKKETPNTSGAFWAGEEVE